MFFNTKLFSGSQYDIKAKVGSDGSVDISDIGATSKIDLSTAYTPDEYMPYKNVQDNTSAQLASVIASRPETPVVTNLTVGTRA